MIRFFVAVNKQLKLIIFLTLVILFLNFYTLCLPRKFEIYRFYANRTSISFEKDNHFKLIDLDDFSFLINVENKCDECKNGTLLVFVVSTSLANTKQRQAIRDTWGENTDCIKILYFIGTSDDENKTRMIQEESETYQDIIQGSFKDAYHNLTYKHIMELKWIRLYCPQARYIVKNDDDLVINVDVLYDKLKKDYWKSTDLLACTVKHKDPVLRNHDKWGISKKEFADDFYPPFCHGPFIIYSADVVKKILEESNKVPFFRLEDVYATGILAKRIGLKHVDLLYTDYYLYNTDELFAKGPKFVKPFIFGPISRTVEQIYAMWNVLKGNLTFKHSKPPFKT